MGVELTPRRGAVLLNELLAQVSSEGWIAAKVEATPGTPLSVALSHALVKSMRTATGRHPEPTLKRLLGVFKAFSLRFNPVTGSVALGADVDLISGIADSGRFADDLAALFEILGETSRELGVGTLILVDELQEATSEELTAVNTAVHQLGQDAVPLPVTFVGAGLPSLPAQLADATSYAERLYDYRRSVCSARSLRVLLSWDPARSWASTGTTALCSKHSTWPTGIPTSSRLSESTSGTPLGEAQSQAKTSP